MIRAVDRMFMKLGESEGKATGNENSGIEREYQKIREY